MARQKVAPSSSAPDTVAPWRLPHYAAVLLAGALGLFQFHRAEFLSGMHVMNGDLGDARLAAWLMEHGWRALHGLVPLTSPPMFYPVTGTLGYSDAYLLPALVYAPLRAAGLSILDACHGAVLLLDIATYLATAALLRRGVGLGVCGTTAGALLFAFGSPKFAQVVHVQLQPLVLLPLAVWLGLWLWRHGLSLSRGRMALGLVVLGVLWQVQWLTGVYVAWFAGMWLALALVVTLLLPLPRAHVRALLHRHALPAVIGVVWFAVGMIPFLLLYLPAQQQAGWRPYALVNTMIPRWWSLFWMGDQSLLWGWLARVFPGIYAAPYYWELAIGLGLVVTGTWLLLLRQLWQRRANWRQWQGRDALLAVLVLSVTACYALGMSYGDASPWALVYDLVPGAGSLRAVARYVVVLTLPIAMAIGIALDASLRAAHVLARGRRRTVWMAGLALALGLGAAEQMGSREGIDKDHEQARIAQIAQTVQKDCSVLFVVSVGGNPAPLWSLQLDAMYVALAAGIPTVNGYSGLIPTGWNLNQVRHPLYTQRVAQWLQDHGTSAVACRVGSGK